MEKTTAKPEKAAPAASAKASPAEGAAKPGRKKLPLILIGVLIVGAAGGAGWYFTQSGTHTTEVKVVAETGPVQPKFISLEPYTVNLQRETGEQFLQVGITLKIADSKELEEKIKLLMPEIRSHLLLLLSSKYPAELTPAEGKKKLAQEIIQEINTVLGLRTAAASSSPNAAAHEGAASDVEAAQPEAAPEAAETAPASGEMGGIIDVLFTSFIIQ